MAIAIFCPVSGVPFCEGRRPVFYGTPTLTEWPMPFFFLFLVLCHSFFLPVSGVVPFCEGRRPVFYRSPTLTEWPVPFFLPVSGVVPFCDGGRAVFCSVSGVVPFREGRRPFFYGTPTLTEWPVPFFFLFLVLCPVLVMCIYRLRIRRTTFRVHVLVVRAPGGSFLKYQPLPTRTVSINHCEYQVCLWPLFFVIR